MVLKKDLSERKVKGKICKIYPEETKQRIVKELEQGRLTVVEAMNRYGVHRKGTILDWLRKYSIVYREQQMQSRHSASVRRQAAFKIASGALSLEGASRQYRVGKETIKDWIKLYSCTTDNEDSMPKKKSSVPAASEEIKALEKQLAFMKLKVEGLETMIDIAERELKIDIRKKSGTKQ